MIIHKAHIVVFDGTSAYIIPKEDLTQEVEQNEVKILGEFNDFNEASDFCDKQNDSIILYTNNNTSNMKTQIEDILNNVLPQGVWSYVGESTIMGENIIKIAFAAKDFNINNVSGQKPQIVSLILYIDSLELRPQVFGGNGGQHIYRKPNMELREEKYLAMKGVKIPFRKPQPDKTKVLESIKRFAENWLKALKENKDVLMYQQYVNYDEILK